MTLEQNTHIVIKITVKRVIS